MKRCTVCKTEKSLDNFYANKRSADGERVGRNFRVLRHGKPANRYLATLKRPTRADWDRLVRACVVAVIEGSVDVLVAFPYVMKFPRGFPKGILEYKTEAENVHRIKVSKLLAWLKARGHTDVTMESLRVQQMLVTRWTDTVDRAINAVGGDFDLG